MGKKKTGAYMGGGMAKKKGSMYNKGGMPMVMKAGKKVPAFAADGVGKMNMGGMAKKKKPMASTGYKEGGTVKKKKETFGQAFKRNRKKFMDSGSAGDYTFKHEGKSYNILQKGETKAGVMKKFSAPKKSLRPKLRPSAGISENTKKKIEETVRKVANTDSKARPSQPRTEKTDEQKRKDKQLNRQLGIPLARGRGAGSFAGKGAGKDKPKAKPVAAPDRKKTRFSTDGKVMGPGQKARPGARSKPSPRILVPDIYLGNSDKAKAANSDKVRAGQAALDKDRAGPQRPAKLSQRNLRKFKNDPSSLTKIQKDRLFKSLKRQGVAIPKGLSGNNR